MNVEEQKKIATLIKSFLDDNGESYSLFFKLPVYLLGRFFTLDNNLKTSNWINSDGDILKELEKLKEEYDGITKQSVYVEISKIVVIKKLGMLPDQEETFECKFMELNGDELTITLSDNDKRVFSRDEINLIDYKTDNLGITHIKVNGRQIEIHYKNIEDSSKIGRWKNQFLNVVGIMQLLQDSNRLKEESKNRITGIGKATGKILTEKFKELVSIKENEKLSNDQLNQLNQIFAFYSYLKGNNWIEKNENMINELNKLKKEYDIIRKKLVNIKTNEISIRNQNKPSHIKTYEKASLKLDDDSFQINPTDLESITFNRSEIKMPEYDVDAWNINTIIDNIKANGQYIQITCENHNDVLKIYRWSDRISNIRGITQLLEEYESSHNNNNNNKDGEEKKAKKLVDAVNEDRTNELVKMSRELASENSSLKKNNDMLISILTNFNADSDISINNEMDEKVKTAIGNINKIMRETREKQTNAIRDPKKNNK